MRQRKPKVIYISESNMPSKQLNNNAPCMRKCTNRTKEVKHIKMCGLWMRKWD